MAGSPYSYGYGDPGSSYTYDYRDSSHHFHMNMGTRDPQSRGSPFSHDTGSAHAQYTAFSQSSAPAPKAPLPLNMAYFRVNKNGSNGCVAAIRRCLVAVCSSQDMALLEEQEMDTLGDFKPLCAEDRIESDTVAIYSRAASVRTYNPRRLSDGLHSSLQRSRKNPKRDSARKTGAPPTEKDRAMPAARGGSTSAKDSSANVTDSPTETSTDSPKRPHISLCQVLASYT